MPAAVQFWQLCFAMFCVRGFLECLTLCHNDPVSLSSGSRKEPVMMVSMHIGVLFFGMLLLEPVADAQASNKRTSPAPPQKTQPKPIGAVEGVVMTVWKGMNYGRDFTG